MGFFRKVGLQSLLFFYVLAVPSALLGDQNQPLTGSINTLVPNGVAQCSLFLKLASNANFPPINPDSRFTLKVQNLLTGARNPKGPWYGKDFVTGWENVSIGDTRGYDLPSIFSTPPAPLTYTPNYSANYGVYRARLAHMVKWLEDRNSFNAPYPYGLIRLPKNDFATLANSYLEQLSQIPENEKDPYLVASKKPRTFGAVVARTLAVLRILVAGGKKLPEPSTRNLFPTYRFSDHIREILDSSEFYLGTWFAENCLDLFLTDDEVEILVWPRPIIKKAHGVEVVPEK